MKSATSIIVASLFIAACGEPTAVDPFPDNNGVANNGTNTSAQTNQETAPPAGSCVYTNPFSSGPECKEYVGEWTDEAIEADCEASQGERSDDACSTDGLLGTCRSEVEGGTTDVFAMGEASGCRIARVACQKFADGTWTTSETCVDDGEEPVVTESSVFQPPERICVEPLAGEPPGQSGGDVCTWQLISGATEEGRRFQDYASCDVVRTQRPAYAYPRPDDAEKDDPRMQDEAYVAELSWVKSQIEATACVCCHQSSLTPDGVSNWDIDQPGNFMNGFYDTGLALGANWVNSIALGAFPPEENNGFDRTISGFPSTDPERMRAFFVGELDYRGLTEADFADAAPFGGPLYNQIYYEPEACPDGVGISADGTVTWEGGAARYLYLLEPGSLSPTVPPNDVLHRRARCELLLRH